MPSWLTVFTGLSRQMRAFLRDSLFRAGLALCGVLLLLGSGGFAVTALYVWLASRMPAHLAALCVAGLLAVAALCFFIAARFWRRRRAPRRVAVPPSAAPALEAALAEVERNPSSAVVAAVALGIIAGLLRPGGRR